MSPNVGTKRWEAELVRAEVEREPVLVTNQLNSTKKSAPFSALIDDFLVAKENIVRATSQHRYRNYLDPAVLEPVVDGQPGADRGGNGEGINDLAAGVSPVQEEPALSVASTPSLCRP